MTIDVRTEGDTVYFMIEGAIDSEGGLLLSEKFNAATSDGAIKNGVFDLLEVPSITSAGIGKLMRFFKHFEKAGGTMKIDGISNNLKTQFHEIHLDQIIEIN